MTERVTLEFLAEQQARILGVLADQRANMAALLAIAQHTASALESVVCSLKRTKHE